MYLIPLSTGETSARRVLVTHFVRDEGHVSSILTALTAPYGALGL